MVKSILGEKKEVDCIGCSLQNGELDRMLVHETENFSVEQDYESPIPGFMIISSKKHIKGIEDLDETGRKEFIELLYKVRVAITKVLDVEYVYIIQKEDTIISRSHFHVWLFPRFLWMDKFGDKIESVTKIVEYSRKKMKTEDNISKVKDAVEKIKKELS